MKRSLLLLLVGGCLSPLAPEQPFQRFLPPASWEQVTDWVWVECGSHARAVPRLSFQELRFYVVPGTVFTVQEQERQGSWSSNRIYLAEDMLSQPGLLVLRHELLHALTGLAHPLDWYRQQNVFRDCWIKAEREFVGGNT